jgi:hypothetical protein
VVRVSATGGHHAAGTYARTSSSAPSRAPSQIKFGTSYAKYHTWITNGTVQSSSFRALAIEPINHKRYSVVGRLVTNNPPSRPRQQLARLLKLTPRAAKLPAIIAFARTHVLFLLGKQPHQPSVSSFLSSIRYTAGRIIPPRLLSTFLCMVLLEMCGIMKYL